jgi:hypothetical protein
MRTGRFSVTPGLLARMSGLPKTTLINWLDGRVKRPRRWQDVLTVADALRLRQNQADNLLIAAGHEQVDRLFAIAQEHETRLFTLWKQVDDSD